MSAPIPPFKTEFSAQVLLEFFVKKRDSIPFTFNHMRFAEYNNIDMAIAILAGLDRGTIIELDKLPFDMARAADNPSLFGKSFIDQYRRYECKLIRAAAQPTLPTETPPFKTVFSTEKMFPFLIGRLGSLQTPFDNAAGQSMANPMEAKQWVEAYAPIVIIANLPKEWVIEFDKLPLDFAGPADNPSLFGDSFYKQYMDDALKIYHDQPPSATLPGRSP